MGQNTAYKSGIDWIDQHASLRAIRAPVDKTATDLDDNLVFEEIESEIMKRGTLAHNNIRWDFVLEQATLLLQEQAKDLRLILFILHSLPHLAPTPSLPAPLPLACHLVSAFLQQWGVQATPQGRARTRILTHLTDALDLMVKKIEENGIEAHYYPSMRQALKQSSDILSTETAELSDKLLSFANRIEKSLEEKSNEQPVSVTPQKQQTNNHNISPIQATSPANALRPSDLVLDSSNERALRESLTKMADFLFDLDNNQPLSYRLRRYACWYGLREQPALKKDTATIILPPSEESVDLYNQAVAQKQTDADITKRLERSCYLQPFWIEGHYLAWKLARGRGAMPVADAIFSEVSQFVKTVPWLHKLQFSSQAPFIPDEVRDWLAHHQNAPSSSAQTQGADENSPINQARTLAAAGDIGQAYAILETRPATFDDLRERTLWELAILELFHEWGMKTHAALSAARLEEAIANLNVSQWDGVILERLRRLKSAAL